jgi:hypothetical protein
MICLEFEIYFDILYILYIFAENYNYIIMENNQKKRKLIDISDRTGKILGMMAVQNNMSFKTYIETLLDDKANEIVEDELITWKDGSKRNKKDNKNK